MAPTSTQPASFASPVDVHRIAAEVASGQHGVVTRDQLLAAGVSARRIRTGIERGRLRRLHRDVYLVGSVAPPRAIPLAACLACGPDAVLSHRSAAALWDLVRPGSAGDPVDVTIGGSRRPRAGIRLHRSRTMRPSERTRLDGVPLTTPTRTLFDLAGHADARTLERAVGEALARGLTHESRLLKILKRFDGRPGSARFRAVLELGPPARIRSEAEERFLELVRRADVPEPRVNVVIGPYEVDFYWPDARLVVEVDGYGPHHSRRAFERDRRRDAFLVAEGLSVMRVTWREMEERPEAVVFRLGKAMARRA